MAPEDAISAPNEDDASSNGPERSDIYPPSINDREIYKYVTTHPSFWGLISRLCESVAHYHAGQMGLISRTITQCFRRLSNEGELVEAKFIVDWDIIGFLQRQYDLGVNQELGSILALTGQSVNAQLSTVRSYLEQTWPTNSLTLLNAIKFAIARNARNRPTGMLLQPT